jgi:hypothetical protein
MYQLYTHCFDRNEAGLAGLPAYTRQEIIELYALRLVDDLKLPLVKHKYRLITDPALHRKMKDKELAHYVIVDEYGAMSDE